MRFRELKLRRDPDCPVCGDRPSIRELIDYEQFCGLKPAAGAAPVAVSSDPEVTVEELHARLATANPPFVLDVREPQEFKICRIPGSTLIPLGELPARLSELPSGREIVVQCKSGVRSAKAVKVLQDGGVLGARNLKGGILAWIDRIDPSLPKY
jgi:adenylyltransferase/sulfurtransferase